MRATGFVVICLVASLANAQTEARSKADRAAPSPDGTRIVFVSDVSGGRDLWITDTQNGNAAVFINWPSDETDPGWAPNGQKVVFSSNRGAAKHHIWQVDANGGNPLKLTSDDAEHEHPRYSPDGTLILYISNATGKRELWVMNPDGSNPHPLALISIRVSDPAWSPNSQAVVYVGCTRGAACNLFRINLDATNPLQITTGGSQDWNPDWSAQGIIFASNRGNSQGLWVVQPDGSGLRQVTDPAGAADLDPRWTTGNGFLFSRSGQGPDDAAADVWSATTAGGSPRRLTSTIPEPIQVGLEVRAGGSTTITVGASLVVNTSATEPNNPAAGPWRYVLDWGDGTNFTATLTSLPTAARPTARGKIYTQPGIYTIVLTITDSNGLHGSRSLIVTVKP
jgi:Tol biopolymer transport system component